MILLFVFLKKISILLDLPPQAKPKEMQATRDFAETRKLELAANDLVTLVEHRWVRGDENL